MFPRFEAKLREPPLILLPLEMRKKESKCSFDLPIKAALAFSNCLFFCSPLFSFWPRLLSRYNFFAYFFLRTRVFFSQATEGLSSTLFSPSLFILLIFSTILQARVVCTRLSHSQHPIIQRRETKNKKGKKKKQAKENKDGKLRQRCFSSLFSIFTRSNVILILEKSSNVRRRLFKLNNSLYCVYRATLE